MITLLYCIIAFLAIAWLIEAISFARADLTDPKRDLSADAHSIFFLVTIPVSIAMMISVMKIYC